MKSLCFLSTDNLHHYEIDDELAVSPLSKLGWEVETVSWHAERDWSEFNAVVIRTTWDYHDHPNEFVATLSNIVSKGCRLENSLETVRWNLEKTYLLDLEKHGIPIVPTLIGKGPVDQSKIDGWLGDFETEELIIKPTISATAKNTFRVNRYTGDLTVFDQRRYLVQPMMESILEKGELSLFYFDGQFSHAIRKRPKTGDFRVQEDFGGQNNPAVASGELRSFAGGVLANIKDTPLYARVDVVAGHNDEPRLMELELIEPALYFRYDEMAADRFAAAIARRFDEL